MSSWTWMLCPQAHGKLKPTEAYRALEQLGMKPDPTQYRIRLFSGEVDVVETLSASRLTAAQRTAAGDQIQVIYRDENLYLSTERILAPTFDCIIFGWTESLMATAQTQKPYRLAMRTAAQRVGAGLTITTSEPPDEWLGMITLQDDRLTIQTTTDRGAVMGEIQIQELDSGAIHPFRRPHPELLQFVLPVLPTRSPTSR